MIGVAFEIHDSNSCERSENGQGDKDETVVKKQELQRKYCHVEVGSLELFSYAFCYIGVLTGWCNFILSTSRFAATPLNCIQHIVGLYLYYNTDKPPYYSHPLFIKI